MKCLSRCYFISGLLLAALRDSTCQTREHPGNTAGSPGNATSHPTAQSSPQSSAQPSTQLTDLRTDRFNLDMGMRRLMNVSSIEEILEMGILSMNGHTLTADDLGATVDNTTGKLLVSGAYSDLGVPDMCGPRMTSVAVKDIYVHPASRLYPTCIRVPRCGGCCGAQNVVCKPAYVERKVYNLLRLSYTGSGLTVMSHFPLEVERHLHCECECDLSEEKCGPLKIFHPYNCTCTCNATDVRCPPYKMYNPEKCGCECAVWQVCCQPNASCILRFNEETCQCDIDRSFASSSLVNVSQADINTYLQLQQVIMASGGGRSSSQNGNGVGSSSSNTAISGFHSSGLQGDFQPITPELTASTTSTTPAPTTTQASNCPTLRCPGRSVKVTNPDGSCICRRSRSRGRG